MSIRMTAAQLRGMGVLPPSKPKKRGMNGTETAYAILLNARIMAGEIQWYAFEAVRLRLADGAYFKPDFCVIMADGTIRFDEVKGHMREAAMVRLKVAASLYPWRFVIVRKTRDGWTYTDVPGRRQ